MKHSVVAMKMHDGRVTVNEHKATKINLPKGCIGMLFVFESKKMAREFWGKDVPTMRIKECTKRNP